MSSANHSFSKLSTAALASVMLFAFGISMQAQTAVVGNFQITGVPDDWTHHHLVFSNPGTEEDAIKKNQREHWLKIVNDPRYVIQQLKRDSTAQGPAGPEAFWIQGIRGDASAGIPRPGKKTTKIEKDWSVSLGGTYATASGTFTGVATTGTVKVNGLTLTGTTSTATGTIGFDADGANIAGDTVTIGSVVYEFASTQTSCTGTYDVCVFYGTSTTTAEDALEAAIDNATGDCPTPTGTWTSTCYTVNTAGDAPNPGASATVTHVTGTTYEVTVTNLTYTTLPLADTESGTDFTLSGASVTQTASCTNATTGKLIIDGNSTTQQATNLAGAINACESTYSTVGVTATSSGATVTVSAATGGTGGNSIPIAEGQTNFTWTGSPEPSVLSGGTNASVQPNAYPSKYGVSLTGASCSDYAIYPTGQAGGSSAATIVAYDNLYAGTGTGTCTTANPTVYWAYNTGTGQSVTTSPILSLDGSQVAFIESNNASPAKASLVLIKWAQETGESVTAPLTLTNQASALAYHNCTPSAATPCMYTILFGNGDDDSLSAPFYDYDGDALYVGDNNGNLHRFINVFNGQPSEDTGPWPVALNANTNKIASPVYDETWHAVFVGDLGGKLYCVTATTGSCQTSPTSLGGGWYEASTTPVAGGQIADAPLINSSANYLLVFVNTSTANSIYGYSEQYFAGTAGGPVSVGAGASGHYLYAGSFDNVYYDSSNYTGNLYVVGNTGATTGASLYQVGLSGGFLTGGSTAVVTGLTASGAYPWPSPLTEFCNNGASPCGAVAGQTISSCTTTHNSTTIKCPTPGTFTASEVGASVSGTDIPAGSTIATFVSATQITISAEATGSTTTTLTVGALTNPGTDYVFFSVNEGNVGGCTGAAGKGCILSYNVTNPSVVAIAGTGQNVTTPAGTNGCWATGGLSIDNSATTTGASEIYFVSLDGATAGGGANSGTPTSSACTPATGAIDATQASQANPSL